MAAFKTHLVIGTIASVATAGFIYSLDYINILAAISLTLVGAFGGILPDIDSDHSRATHVVFTLFGIVAACFLFIWYYSIFPILVLLTLSVAMFILIRFPVKYIFGKFTVHRGLFHSILAALMIALITVCIAYHIFLCTPAIAWFSGLFIATGYIVHLLLDEIYSVDFSNQRIKRSFGSAFKLLCFRRLHNSIIAIIISISVYFLTPEITTIGNQSAKTAAIQPNH